jgi:hypothetical protein
VWGQPQCLHLSRSDQISAKSIQAVSNILMSAVHKRINSMRSKEKLPDQRKASVLYQFSRRVIKLTNNYRGISLLSTLYKKTLLNILPLKLSPYIDEIIGDHQCGFRHNRSTIYQITCIRQIWRKNLNTMRQSAIHRLQESQ